MLIVAQKISKTVTRQAPAAATHALSERKQVPSLLQVVDLRTSHLMTKEPQPIATPRIAQIRRNTRAATDNRIDNLGAIAHKVDAARPCRQLVVTHPRHPQKANQPSMNNGGHIALGPRPARPKIHHRTGASKGRGIEYAPEKALKEE